MKRHTYTWIGCLALLVAACSDSSGSSSGGSPGGEEPGSPNPGEEHIVVGCNAQNCAATCCGDVCRDTTENAAHCGACGHACGDTQICVDSQCVDMSTPASVCGVGEAWCDGECVSIVRNPEHCGSCHHTCGEGFVCEYRSCEIDCGGKARCGDACIDLLTDSENCGFCGFGCSEGRICVSGLCTDICPTRGESVCSRECVDMLTDVEHCGSCDNVCVDDGTTCLDGACSTTCADPAQTVCAHVCTDLMRDAAHCGACDIACQSDERCAEGVCVNTCDEETQRVCDHVCLDVSQDNDHCGACDVACQSDERCVEGVCVNTCNDEFQRVCDHVCVHVQEDSAHCGACGHACPEKQICVEGSCVCPESDPLCDVELPTCTASQRLCGVTCVDVQTDVSHCGACDHACAESSICVSGTCVDCTDKTMCGSICYDLQSDPDHCGSCDSTCPNNVACVNGSCQGCQENTIDCDGDPSNGCEKTTAECDCQNGDTRSCYYGPAGTLGVGACSAGIETCTGNHWGDCVGMVLPDYDIVCNPSNPAQDLDCNGIPDGTGDADHDGVTLCGGDCCDTAAMCPGISDPALVRPGFYEDPHNKVDDNCNGVIDETSSTCTAAYTYGTDLSQASARSAAGTQLARAMDICEMASELGYGLVSAEVSSLNSTNLGNTGLGRAINVFPYLASTSAPTVPVISPQKGGQFAGMSSGYFLSGAVSGYANNQTSSFISGGTIPTQYSKVHSALQSAPGCSTSNNINDSVHLKLVMKAPINATGFQFDFRFFSHEYPYYICSSFNDFFLALLESSHPDIPADGNIAFDKNGNPVSVNNAFFTNCQPKSCSKASQCASGIYTAGCVAGKCTTAYGACPDGVNDLKGFTSISQSSTSGGGATAWLTTTAPIVGGETFTLHFYIWDTGDSNLDSAAILDNFRWVTNGSVSVGTDFSDGRT